MGQRRCGVIRLGRVRGAISAALAAGVVFTLAPTVPAWASPVSANGQGDQAPLIEVGALEQLQACESDVDEAAVVGDTVLESSVVVEGATPVCGEGDEVVTGYVVALDPGVDAAAVNAAIEDTGAVALGGGSDVATSVWADDASVDALTKVPGVAVVETDRMITLAAPVEQQNPVWGLDRIDQESLPLDQWMRLPGDGSGVRVYVIDTGLRTSHGEFAGRVGTGANFVDDDAGAEDCQGHGTHVSGTAAGSTYGVAKGATVVPLRSIGCGDSGPLSASLAAVSWVIDNHPAGTPGVVNMSLTSGYSQVMDAAVTSLANAGILPVVAAGNDERSNACNYSPASNANAITVGATNNDDSLAWYSNVGSCVDLLAPGSSVISAGIASDTSAALSSGTSMASPHVAGLAAVLWGSEPHLTALEVRQRLTSSAVTGKITDVPAGTANLLAQVSKRVPTVVKNLTASSDTSDITITWDAPDYIGETSDAVSYEFSLDEQTTWTPVEEGITEVVVPERQLTEDVEIAVRAVTAAGPGPVATVTREAFNLSVPADPTVTIEQDEAGAVEVTFATPDTGGADVTFHYKTLIDGQVSDWTQLPQGENVAKLGTLNAGIYVMVWANAQNVVGASEDTYAHYVVPEKITIPAAPTVQFWDTSDGSTVTALFATQDTGGEDVTYRYIARVNGTWGTWGNVPNNGNSVVFSDITDGAVVDVVVKAANSAGMSDYRQIYTYTAPEEQQPEQATIPEQEQSSTGSESDGSEETSESDGSEEASVN